MAQVFTGDGTLVDAVCLLTFPLLVLLVAKDKTIGQINEDLMHSHPIEKHTAKPITLCRNFRAKIVKKGSRWRVQATRQRVDCVTFEHDFIQCRN